jgi:hypothetical protein
LKCFNLYDKDCSLFFKNSISSFGFSRNDHVGTITNETLKIETINNSLNKNSEIETGLNQLKFDLNQSSNIIFKNNSYFNTPRFEKSNCDFSLISNKNEKQQSLIEPKSEINIRNNIESRDRFTIPNEAMSNDFSLFLNLFKD